MAAAGLTDEVVSKAKQSRSEKKSRKAMSKLGEWTIALQILHALRSFTHVSRMNLLKKNLRRKC